MRRLIAFTLAIILIASGIAQAQRYTAADGRLRVALAKQPFSPTGTAAGPNTMANGGIQKILEDMGATVRVEEAALNGEEAKEYGGWKRLGMALGHFADIVTKNERDGYFTVGLLATCPSMPGLVAGLEHSGPTRKPIKRRRSAQNDASSFRSIDRLSRLTDKIYVHIDMDVLDPREVMGHGNTVPNGPSSEELAKLFETIFSRYPKASAIGFATIPSTDEGGLSLAAVNRMIAGAVRGVKAREQRR